MNKKRKPKPENVFKLAAYLRKQKATKPEQFSNEIRNNASYYCLKS